MQSVAACFCLTLQLNVRHGLESLTDVKGTHPELEAAKVVDALNVFAENLYNPDKGIRVSTLRILCHYELLKCEASRSKQLAEQHLGLGTSDVNHVENGCCSVTSLAIFHDAHILTLIFLI